MTSYANLPDEQRTTIETLLTQRQLAVFKARYDHHPWAAIADALNLDEATVRGHHKRAVRRLNNARKEHAA